MENIVEADWTTSAGNRAVVLRTRMGHRCGYVAVNKGTPFFGVGYGEDVPALAGAAKDAESHPIGKRGIVTVFLDAIAGGYRPRLESIVDVHGSLTYSGDGGGKYPVDSKAWWFGFDAAHCDDEEDGGRPLEYMRAECGRLAEQLAALAATLPA